MLEAQNLRANYDNTYLRGESFIVTHRRRIDAEPLPADFDATKVEWRLVGRIGKF